MAGRGTSLGPLLIISAIDLLLCCLTAALMLFLIFQPTQRSDRSSALFHGTAGDGQSRQLLASGRQATTIVMVDNFGETRLVAKGASDYQVVASASATSTIFRSVGPVGPLRLSPADPGSRFVAHIAVTKRGKLFSGDWECVGGAISSVTVDASSDPPVTMNCPNRCIASDSPDLPGNVHLLLIPKADPAPVKVPTGQCYWLRAGESFDDVRRLAVKCGVATDPASREFSRQPAQYQCLWTSFSESTKQNCNGNGVDRVGFWVDSRPPSAPGQVCEALDVEKRE